MKMKDAMEIINKIKIESKNPTGFRVHFEHLEKSILYSDYFPERDEPLIETVEEAWKLAENFAEKTKGSNVNIYVTNENNSPVAGYEQKYIKNR